MAPSAAGAIAIPSTVRPAPPTMASAKEVCTACETASWFCAPKCWATTTVVPEEIPTKRLTRRLISTLVLPPTAASASVPTKRPTMTASTVL